MLVDFVLTFPCFGDDDAPPLRASTSIEIETEQTMELEVSNVEFAIGSTGCTRAFAFLAFLFSIQASAAVAQSNCGTWRYERRLSALPAPSISKVLRGRSLSNVAYALEFDLRWGGEIQRGDFVLHLFCGGNNIGFQCVDDRDAVAIINSREKVPLLRRGELAFLLPAHILEKLMGSNNPRIIVDDISFEFSSETISTLRKMLPCLIEFSRQS